MMGSTERRNVKAKRDAKNSKIMLTYERVVEMDLTDVLTKINEVKSYIAQMEFHIKRLEAEIKDAKQELVLLQGAYIVGEQNTGIR